MDVRGGAAYPPSGSWSSAMRDVELCFESRDGPRDVAFILGMGEMEGHVATGRCPVWPDR
jgi:hypothetical protein